MDNAPETDIEGDPRPNPTGTNPDMGAYEHENYNPVPLAYNQSISVDEDNEYNGIMLAYDGNGDVLDHYVESYPSNGELTLNSLTALSFDGVDDYVDCGNGSGLNVVDSFTIEANIYWVSGEIGYVLFKWLYSGPGIGVQIIGSSTDYYSLNNNSLCLWVRANGTWYSFNSPSNSIQKDEWYHIAATYENGAVSLYIDGVSQEIYSSGDLSGSIDDHLDATMSIGGQGWDTHHAIFLKS